MAIPEDMPDALADIIRAHGGEWRDWRLGAHRWFAAGSPHNIYAAISQNRFSGIWWARFWTKSDTYDDDGDFKLALDDASNWNPENFSPGLEEALKKPPLSTKDQLVAIAGQCKASNVSYVKELILKLANSLDN